MLYSPRVMDTHVDTRSPCAFDSSLPHCFVRTLEVIPHRGEVAAHGGNNLVEQQSLGHQYNIMKNVIIANLAGAESGSSGCARR